MAYLHRAKNKIVDFKRVSVEQAAIDKYTMSEFHMHAFFCNFQTFTDPSSVRLLPDELPHPYQRPYTVVLELNDVLIHTEYDVSGDGMVTL